MTAQTSEQGFSISRRTTSNGEIGIEVRDSEGMTAGAYVHKYLDLDVTGNCMRWRAAEVSYPSYGGRPVGSVLRHVALIAFACSLATVLDVEFPAGLKVKSEDVVARPI